MMNVKIQTSTSTKNSTVNAVGNLNRCLGSAVVSPVSSILVCVSAVMALAAGPRRSQARRLVAASLAHPQARIAKFDSCSLLESRRGIITLSRVIPARFRRL
jgi:hypothetical protein